MALQGRRTEHAGHKGSGRKSGFWGGRSEAKSAGRRIRRGTDRAEVDAGISDAAQVPETPDPDRWGGARPLPFTQRQFVAGVRALAAQFLIRGVTVRDLPVRRNPDDVCLLLDVRVMVLHNALWGRDGGFEALEIGIARDDEIRDGDFDYETHTWCGTNLEDVVRRATALVVAERIRGGAGRV